MFAAKKLLLARLSLAPVVRVGVVWMGPGAPESEEQLPYALLILLAAEARESTSAILCSCVGLPPIRSIRPYAAQHARIASRALKVESRVPTQSSRWS